MARRENEHQGADDPTNHPQPPDKTVEGTYTHNQSETPTTIDNAPSVIPFSYLSELWNGVFSRIIGPLVRFTAERPRPSWLGEGLITA